MPAESFPPHPERWTLADVLALPEDQGNRVELVDGLVVMSPSPTSRHQRVLTRILLAFVSAAPPEYEALPEVNVVLNEERLLIPDLSIVNEPGVDTVYYKGADVLLVVEVHSPSTRAFDLALKRKLYGEAGVPFVLFVDPGPEEISARLFELSGDSYREVASSAAGVLTFTRPFPLTVNLSGSGS